MGIRSFVLKSYLLILPVLAIVTVFTVYPVVYAVVVSFKEYSLIRPGPYSFVGIVNYLEIFRDTYFLGALLNTLSFTVSCVVITTVLGLLIALLLDQNIRGTGFAKVVVFLPWTVPYIAVGILWKLFFTSEWGFLTKLLRVIGLLEANASPAWLTYPFVARIAVVIAEVWHELPLAILFFLAGLQTVPKELLDAVRIDGGGSFATLRHIILPILKPVTTIVIILNALMALITFDVVYVMTGGGPAGKTSLLSYYGYTKSFRFLNFGEGAATSIVITCITIVIVYSLFNLYAAKE
jgi:ABC-type sugar transport system permease subunit